MSEKTTAKSILEMREGAFLELCDREVANVMENIRDVNTKPTAKRVITIKLVFVPTEDRANVGVDFKVESKLAPAQNVSTWLYDSGDSVVELTPAVPGQMTIDGSEQERPPHLRLIVNN